MSNEMLAQALVSDQPQLITIPVYYRYKKNKFGHLKLETLSDEDAQKALENPEQKESIHVVNFQWRVPIWGDQNNIVKTCYQVNEFTGKREINWGAYRDQRISQFLFGWDVELNGQRLPVTEEFIRKMPPELMVESYDRFEKAVGFDPDDQGK
jgi:hypothetical protein